ncbi:hypothetical protein DB346_10940 [Verrucomicrobia bacterium LW23]|nr:hypothetical protein DB346_10940 [Verrucomicrobia bacterium LW23]
MKAPLSPTFRHRRRAFSLVEVALALGVVSFALLSVLALLLVGVRSNQISTEETRATYLLSLVEADLRNTHPLLGAGADAGKSLQFKLQLPYRVEPTTEKYQVNTDIQAQPTSLVPGTTSIGVTDADRPTSLTGASRPAYQVSVVYLYVPAAGVPDTVQARVVVNWPAVVDNDVASITDPTKVKGFVETTVSFPSP